MITMSNFFFSLPINSSWHKRSQVLQICHEYAWHVFQLPAHFPCRPSPGTVLTQHCLAESFHEMVSEVPKFNEGWCLMTATSAVKLLQKWIASRRQPAAPASITESQTCRGWKPSFTPALTLLLPSQRYILFQMHHSAPDWTNTSSHLSFSVRTLRCHRRCHVCQILTCQTFLSVSFSK